MAQNDAALTAEILEMARELDRSLPALQNAFMVLEAADGPRIHRLYPQGYQLLLEARSHAALALERAQIMRRDIEAALRPAEAPHGAPPE